LREFLEATVTENTRKGYERYCEEWCTFVRDVAGSDDPYSEGRCEDSLEVDPHRIGWHRIN
jgi:hypothetical protein